MRKPPLGWGLHPWGVGTLLMLGGCPVPAEGGPGPAPAPAWVELSLGAEEVGEAPWGRPPPTPAVPSPSKGGAPPPQPQPLAPGPGASQGEPVGCLNANVTVLHQGPHQGGCIVWAAAPGWRLTGVSGQSTCRPEMLWRLTGVSGQSTCRPEMPGL